MYMTVNQAAEKWGGYKQSGAGKQFCFPARSFYFVCS